MPQPQCSRVARLLRVLTRGRPATGHIGSDRAHRAAVERGQGSVGKGVRWSRCSTCSGLVRPRNCLGGRTHRYWSISLGKGGGIGWKESSQAVWERSGDIPPSCWGHTAPKVDGFRCHPHWAQAGWKKCWALSGDDVALDLLKTIETFIAAEGECLKGANKIVKATRGEGRLREAKEVRLARSGVMRGEEVVCEVEVEEGRVRLACVCWRAEHWGPLSPG